MVADKTQIIRFGEVFDTPDIYSYPESKKQMP
jgi:hypothetical protein